MADMRGILTGRAAAFAEALEQLGGVVEALALGGAARG